jgi:transcriptional regulator GlxA family with amidase domain
MKRAIELLRDSERHVTARELAERLDLNPVRLARAFRRFEGESVGDYALHRRLDRAHRLVVTTSSSIADIAHSLGFSDHAHLTRRFKRQFGFPPSALRRPPVAG